MKYRAPTLRASAAYIGFEGLSRRRHELLNTSWSCIHGDDDDLDFEESRTYLKTKALPPTRNAPLSASPEPLALQRGRPRYSIGFEKRSVRWKS